VIEAKRKIKNVFAKNVSKKLKRKKSCGEAELFVNVYRLYDWMETANAGSVDCRNGTLLPVS